jgi:hypothetical protein
MPQKPPVGLSQQSGHDSRPSPNDGKGSNKKSKKFKNQSEPALHSKEPQKKLPWPPPGFVFVERGSGEDTDGQKSGEEEEKQEEGDSLVGNSEEQPTTNQEEKEEQEVGGEEDCQDDGPDGSDLGRPHEL